MANRRHHLVFFCDPPYFGGAEGYVEMLAQARPSEAWHLSALLPVGDGGAVLAERLAAAGAEVHRFVLRHPADPRLWVDLRRRLRRIGGEILHMNLPSVYDARLSVPAVIAKLAGYRRVVTTEHLPMVERARRRLVVKTLLSPAIDAIIVHTEWNRRTLASKHHMPARKMVVIPNGSAPSPEMSAPEIAALRSELGVEPGEVAIVVVGRLTARKGHAYLLDALAQLPAEGWKLIVVGEGEEDGALEAHTARLGLEGRVRFLGQRTDARRIITACDLMALASLLETQPLVITEAMASGKPVVATRIYGIPEIIEDGVTGRLVPPARVEPLAEALRELVDSPARREEMGRSALARYHERFTLERMGTRTYEVLGGEVAA